MLLGWFLKVAFLRNIWGNPYLNSTTVLFDIEAEQFDGTNLSELIEEISMLPDNSALTVSDTDTTDVLNQLQILSYLADKVWSESTKDSVCLSPGCTNQYEWLVQSIDLHHKSPYFVECHENDQMVCEKRYGIFKRSRTFPHIITVANQLDKYIAWMNKQKGLPVNVSKLAAIDMPKGSRKKGIHG